MCWNAKTLGSWTLLSGKDGCPSSSKEREKKPALSLSSCFIQALTVLDKANHTGRGLLS